MWDGTSGNRTAVFFARGVFRASDGTASQIPLMWDSSISNEPNLITRAPGAFANTSSWHAFIKSTCSVLTMAIHLTLSHIMSGSTWSNALDIHHTMYNCYSEVQHCWKSWSKIWKQCPRIFLQLMTRDRPYQRECIPQCTSLQTRGLFVKVHEFERKMVQWLQ